MKTQEIRIDEIRPYENNPRFNDNAVDAVAKSIEQFGFQQPLVLDKNKVIIVGHTRYKASLKLGLETVPCIIADNLTEEQVKAYRLADNKVGEMAQWNYDALNIELNEIEIDMSDFGFVEVGEDFLSSIFNDESQTTEKEENEDEEKEVVYKVVVEFDDHDEAQEFLETCKEQDLKCKMEE